MVSTNQPQSFSFHSEEKTQKASKNWKLVQRKHLEMTSI